MEKTARKPSADQSQERLRQNKALWNKDVSAFVNDLIHFKKMMNGWPSKFFKERSRITDAVPADPATIIGSLVGDFQEIASRGNAIIQEQLNYSKNRRQKQPKQMNSPLGDKVAPPTEAPKPDLTQQLALPHVAFLNSEIIKLASSFEEKYAFNSLSSNPLSRFFTKLKTPQIGFGEAVRIRRMRRNLLDNCVKSYKDLKKLHNEIMKSSSVSIVNSHKLMTQVWNHWNIVNRIFSAYKLTRPQLITDVGGQIEAAPEIKADREAEGEQENKTISNLSPTVPSAPEEIPLYRMERGKNIIADVIGYGKLFSTPNTVNHLTKLENLVDKLRAMPKKYRDAAIQDPNIELTYGEALANLNIELNTNGSSLKEISTQLKRKSKEVVLPPPPVLPAVKEAQLGRWLGKIRHQILPGGTSGPRLEVYNLINQIKRDLDAVMNLLENGLDEDKLTVGINTVNKGMTSLRTMIRAIYYSEKPDETPTSPFF